VELSNVAKGLLPLTNHEVVDLARALHLSDLDIDREMKQSSDTHGCVLNLLCNFKKQCPATQHSTKRCLAKALMEWGRISIALQLYPRSKNLF